LIGICVKFGTPSSLLGKMPANSSWNWLLLKYKILLMKIKLSILIAFTTLSITAQKIVRYDLYVRDTIVNYSGKEKRAIAVNGQIPMPTLTFTEGDIAEIYVHNELNETTSLHWHGLFLPNKEDGVPNLTQMPIQPGTTHKYTFPIIQSLPPSRRLNSDDIFATK
jgi:hypothetical protein